MKQKIQIAFYSFLLAISPMNVSAMSYKEGKDKLTNITSKVWFEGDWGLTSEMLYMINSFVQMVFWFTKFIFSVASFIYENLTGEDKFFDTAFTTTLDVSASIYNGLLGEGKSLIGAMMAMYLAYVFFVKNGSFFRTLFRLLLTFACASMFFYQSNGSYVMKNIYDGMNQINTSIVSVATAASDGLKTDGLSSGNKEAVLDKYFDIAIWKPYVAMNNEGDKLNEEELEKLVDYKSGDNDFEIDGNKIKNIAGSDKEPANKMLKDSWGEKFSYAFASLLDVTVLGLILDALAISTLILKVMLLLLVLISPFALFASLIPSLENILFNFLKKWGTTIILSGLLSFISIIILWFYDLLSTSLETIFGGNIIISAIVKVIVFWIIWKKRDFLISILTANHLTTLDNKWTRGISNVGDKVRQGTLEPVKRNTMSKLALAGATLGGAGIMMKRGADSFVRRKASEGTSQIGKKIVDAKAKRLVQKGDSQELASLQAKNRQSEQKERLLNVGRRMSVAKNSLQGRIKEAQAAYYGSRSDQSRDLQVKYRDTKESAQQHLTRAKTNSEKISGSAQREWNNRTKERLVKQRLQRSESPVSRFKESYLPKEKALTEAAKKKVPEKQSRLSIPETRIKGRR